MSTVRFCSETVVEWREQVRAMVEMLPSIPVVPDDGFNSHPTDPKLMGPETLQHFREGATLPSTTMPTPLVSIHRACAYQLRSDPVANIYHCGAVTYHVPFLWDFSQDRPKRGTGEPSMRRFARSG